MCQVLMIVARYCRVTVTVLESMPLVKNDLQSKHTQPT